MSTIPAELSTIRSATAKTASSDRRLPRALGWLAAAAMSAIFWTVILQVLRALFRL